MKRFLAFFLIVFFINHPAFAFLEASLSKSQVAMDEVFQVYLRSNAPVSLSDFKAYTNDFFLKGHFSSSRMTFVNGKQNQVYETVLNLSPKKTGKLTLPAVTALGVNIPAYQIIVTEANKTSEQTKTPTNSTSLSANQNQEPDIILKGELSKQTVYEGEELLYSLKFYMPEMLVEGNIIPPESPDYTLTQIGNEETSQVQINDSPFILKEILFLLRPKKTGTITVPPARFIGSFSQSRSFFPTNVFNFDPLQDDPFSLLRSSSQRVTASSDKKTLTVLPFPLKNGNSFPAENVHIGEKLDPSNHYYVGDAITRTVTLTAQGSSADYMPDVSFPENPDFKQYPSKPETNNYVKNNVLFTTKTQQIVFIPTKSGNLTLPSFSFHWFDTKTKQTKKATVASKNIIVSEKYNPEKKKETVHPLPLTKEMQQSKPAPLKTPSLQNETSLPEKENSVLNKQIPFFKKSFHPWQILIIGFVSGIGLILLILLIVKSAFHSDKTVKEKTNNKTTEKSDKKKIIEKIRHACDDNNPFQIRDALKEWGNFLYPENPPKTLSELATFFDSDEIKEEITKLNQALYANPPVSWDGQTFFDVFKASKPRQNKQNQKEKDLITPLYPL